MLALLKLSPVSVVILLGIGGILPSRTLPQEKARQTALEPYDLRCDGTERPLGLDDVTPRLSWKVRSSGTTPGSAGRNRRQTAWQVLAASRPELLKADRGDLWDSGKVTADRLPYVVYRGKPLRSRQRVYWSVRTWDENGLASAFSAKAGGPQIWEMGLLQPADWSAHWVSRSRPYPGSENAQFAEDPAPLLRREFDVDKPIASARAYVSGLGFYELRLNGAKCGDSVLEPGWTDYSKRVPYAVYDVTGQIRPGRNAVGAMLGNGWYNPLPLRMWGHLNLREHLTIGPPRLLCQIEIQYRDGSRQIIASGESWRWHDGPVLKNSLYLGELYDARKEQSGWDRPGLQADDWLPVRLTTEPVGTLTRQLAPPIRVTRTLTPVGITTPKPGVFIFDMGRNFAGEVRLRVHGLAGTRVTLRYGELLYPDGSLNPMTSAAGQIKGRRVEPGSEAPSTAWQTDAYILKGEGEEVYMPRFTFHGFRYVEITGFPGTPTLDTLTGLRMNSDVPPAGSFACSNPLFNTIQEMVQWTELSNIFSVQSDCPHREKFGYGGDIAATSEMAMLNFDMSRFYSKTVQDYADAVRPNGGFTETAPFVGIADAGLGEGAGPVEWGTAHPLLLWQMYQYYGDRRQVEAQFDRAKQWMKLLEAKAVGEILDNGIGDHEGLARPSTALSGTAFYYANARLMAKLAGILDRKPDQSEYEALAGRIRAAFQARFDPNQTGKVETGTQSGQAFALYYGLLPKTSEKPALGLLVKQVLETGNGHLSTGIFGTKYLLNALTDQGRADVVSVLANQKTIPGWGAMVASGATTLWEHWDFSDNTFSHNHPMFGSISEWFYKALAGIAPAPDAAGFDRVLIHPRPVPGMKWARGEYRSVRGTIATSWKRETDRFTLDVTIPENTTALVTVPAQAIGDVSEGKILASQAPGVKFVHLTNGKATFAIGSGTYHFVSRSLPPASAGNIPY